MKELFSKSVKSLEDLREEVKNFLSYYLKEKTIVLLQGPMGVGKTQWVSFLLEELGSEEACSPSFSIHNSYELSSGRIVDHLDLYRLKNDEDLESTGFWDLFSREQGLILIEWGDRLEEKFLPMGWDIYFLSLEKMDQSEQRLMRLEVL